MRALAEQNKKVQPMPRRRSMDQTLSTNIKLDQTDLVGLQDFALSLMIKHMQQVQRQIAADRPQPYQHMFQSDEKSGPEISIALASFEGFPTPKHQ